MRIEPFELERWQSTHEHDVEINLSESGVHPPSVAELLALEGTDVLELEALGRVHLGYPRTNGSEELRARIAALYPGASAGDVLVTHGGAEANLVACLATVEPGDEVVVLLPSYMQAHGLARALGATVKPWPIRAELGWAPDPDELDELVGPRTRLVLLTTPNNPTGRILRAPVLDAVARAAERVGAWVLSDEIYRGVELEPRDEAPTMWGRTDRLLVTSGLSKAYGLPGLRTGWVVCGQAGAVEPLWARKDYTTIAVSPVTMALAAHALDPARRRALLERARSLLRANLAAVRERLAAAPGLFDAAPPEAGAMLWMRYDAPIDSRTLAERMRVEHRTLVVPGAHFGHERFVRLGFGGPQEPLLTGLDRLIAFLRAER